MKRYVSYNAATGRIDAVYYLTDESFAVQQIPLIEVPVDYRAFVHYVVDGNLVERQPLAATWSKITLSADGVDEAVLSPLPDPCTVVIDDEPHVVDGGELIFSAAAPGVYRVQIDEIAYLPAQWEIIAE